MRWARKVAVIVVAVLLVAWVGTNVYGAWYIAHRTTHHGAEPVVSGPGIADVVYSGRLHGYLYAASRGPTDVAAVYVHGANSTRADVDPQARALAAAGVTGLSIQLRSDQGEAYGGGQRETHDIAAAVAYLQAGGHPNVALVGFSMGGFAVLVAAAQRLPVVAVVDDSGYGSTTRQAADHGHLPRWLFSLMPVVYPYVSDGGHLLDLGRELQTHGHCMPATLVIQGLADHDVTPDNGREVARQVGGALWALPGVGHVGAFDHDRPVYVEHVTTFLRGAQVRC